MTCRKFPYFLFVYNVNDDLLNQKKHISYTYKNKYLQPFNSVDILNSVYLPRGPYLQSCVQYPFSFTSFCKVIQLSSSNTRIG